MDFFKVIILGIVEGITEFLPVSSTGHLILASKILRLESTEFLKSFEIAIQFGAILAVVVLYGKTLLRDRKVLQQVALAFIPTAVIGFVLHKPVKQYLLGNEVIVSMALFVGGILMILFEKTLAQKAARKNKTGEMEKWKFVAIGIFQSLALIPGVSRSAATILGGLALGFERKAITEFSFILAIPTMGAATTLDLLKSGASFTGQEISWLLCGMIVSFITAWFSIRFLLHFIQKHTFISFGIYRIAIALLFTCFFILG